MREKIFHDTVHGDIFVPSNYCSQIIDTILFQRLRRIEQTSMRSLYPCARHDRFIHSIGVFHLGSKFIKSIEINTEIENQEFWETIRSCWQGAKESYKIACLLHDIGHSPFSHTFEDYFDLKEPKLTEQLTALINDSDFTEDIKLAADPKPHEKTSAFIAYNEYNQVITKLGGNAIDVVRMILGVLYLEPQNTEQKVVNCLIPLLHGSIDVDRLDYACRDQWASGFSSARVNLNRILSSGLLMEYNDTIIFCFNKNAISQLQSLIDIKNYQKTWVLGHHKVLYDQHILKKSVEELASNLAIAPEMKDDVLSQIFNINVFLKTDYHIKDSKLYLLSDDDLIYLMKQSLDKNSFAKEWLSRIHTKKPLWKTESQYIELFQNSNLIDDSKIEKKILKIQKDKKINFSYFILSAKRGLDSIIKNEVKIYVNNNIIDYSVLKYNKPYHEKDFDKVYYVYIESEYMSYTDSIIKEIKKIT